MHDPMTVAFEIKSPIKRKSQWWPHGYRETLVTIWHCDPEKHGDDDSCGWSFVRLSKDDLEWAAKLAKDEYRFWFGAEYDIINHRLNDNLEILAAVWLAARHRAIGKAQYKPLTSWDIGEIFHLMVCSGDNFGNIVRSAKNKEEDFERMIVLTLRCFRTAIRPWYKKPRWHFWHWRFQVHPIQQLKRFLFSRCAGCGGRFTYGYSPTTGQWDSKGPQWFRSEQGVYHSECMKTRVLQMQGTDNVD